MVNTHMFVFTLSGLFVLGIGVAVAIRKHIRQLTADAKQARQLLEESELRFRILTRATNEAVWDWNIETDGMWWNRNVQTLFGYGEEDIGVTSAWRLQNVHTDDRERVQTSLQTRVQRNEDFWSAEYRFRRADGTYAEIFDRGYILRGPDGRAVRMIGSMMDMTKRKREMDLALARDAALESARLKSQFLANMSHEIRTPMNSVIGMTDILLHTELTAEQREFVEIVRMSGESLLTIINDILDFSKIEAGKLTFEILEFEPRAAVEDVVVMLAEQTHAKKLRLYSSVGPDVPETVCGDPGRLRQVLTNLVVNAIKFTTHGNINIRTTRQTDTDTHVILRFEVADTGIGVPEEARACLFQPFSQVDASTTRKYGGTGLGLAICKQLVNLMAGEIGCDSVPDKGSTFWFTVRFEKPMKAISPVEIPPEGPEQTLDSRGRIPADARTRIRILVVEDNIFNQKVVLRQVREMGFGANAVANGIEALEAHNRIPYDLVLMDCQMSEMDGYECAAEIRRREDNTKHVPIIAMTAHVMKEDRDKCLAAGMDDFLSKPVRVAQLENVLIRWLAVTSKTMGGEGAIPLSDIPEALAPPIDWEIFNELAGNNPGRVKELSDRYLRQTAEQLANLHRAITTGAAADIKRIAHSVAGSSAMCGMNDMTALLREMEKMGQTERLTDAPQVQARIEGEFVRIKQFFCSQFEPVQINESHVKEAPML